MRALREVGNGRTNTLGSGSAVNSTGKKTRKMTVKKSTVDVLFQNSSDEEGMDAATFTGFSRQDVEEVKSTIACFY